MNVFLQCFDSGGRGTCKIACVDYLEGTNRERSAGRQPVCQTIDSVSPDKTTVKLESDVVEMIAF